MGSSNQVNVCILGASGYTGSETVRLLHNHPNANILFLSADKNAGRSIGEVHKNLATANLPKLVDAASVDYSKIDVVFCCLPHGVSQQVVADLPTNVKVIDLSADYRLNDIIEYNKWYGHPHVAPALQQQAVYGLVEHKRDLIKKARLVANPGCYPTSAILPLWPLLKAGIISSDIIIDAKSATSGAGRSLREGNLFCEVNESFSVYGIPNHRHLPEIEQELTEAAGKEIQVTFTPHLVPMRRGILSAIYAKCAGGTKAALDVLNESYANEPFVKIIPEGMHPSTAMVSGSNMCAINVFDGRRKGEVVIVSVIDNLVKGASGQAVQNMNVMFDLDESAGLKTLPIRP